MDKTRIMVVDDEEGMLEVCGDILCKIENAVVVLESKSPRAAERLASEYFDILITDIRMPGIDGVELLHTARKRDPDLTVLMLTAFPSIETAVESMKLGAADYITKPFHPDDLLSKVRGLIEKKRLGKENRLLRRQMERPYAFDDIIGQSPIMQTVFDVIAQVAKTNVDVLIVGETGVGKELVARSIHKQSQRCKGRFVPVDCGAISESLLESEFFGHERGAFTGAHRQSMGLMEFADGGTCFLDEIANLPKQLQIKLLRAIQERKFRRVGGTEEIAADIRIVAATNRDLTTEVREERFSQDLYYRINVARIDIPPLRERREDIPLLIDHFLTVYAPEMGKAEVTVDSEVVEVLSHCPWPGNVRELQNVIKRALVTTRHDMLTTEDLPDEIVIMAGDRTSVDREGFFRLRDQRMAQFEKEYLTQLLTVHQGDVTAAAHEALIPRGTIYRLMKKHDLDADDFRSRVKSP